MLIYKTLLGLTPPYLRHLLQSSSSTYNTRSASHILLIVPKAHTSLGHSPFQFAAASDWNALQQTLKLGRFISISSFECLMDTLTDSCCFVWCIVVSTFLPFVRFYLFIATFTHFSPQFHDIQLVVTVLSHRCNSHMDSGEAKVESRASSETQPNQAALLLDTMPT